MRTFTYGLLGTLLGLSACSAAAVSQSVTAGPAGTPRPTPAVTTPSPSARPSATLAPPPTPTASSSDRPLRVVAVDGLNLRAAPGTDAPVETVGPGAGPYSGQPIRVSAGDLVWVIEDERVGSEVWYHVVVDLSYLRGWVSGGPDDGPWLAPFDPTTCPGHLSPGVEWYDEPGSLPPLMAALAEGQMLHSMRYPACYGDEPLGAVVYWPTPGEAGTDVPCPWEGQRWLHCYEYVNTSGNGARQLAVYGAPQDRNDIRRGEWVTINGHYNDPRSENCRIDVTDEAERLAAILFCRAAFVLESVHSPPVP